MSGTLYARTVTWLPTDPNPQAEKRIIIGPPSGMGTSDEGVTSEVEPFEQTLRVAYLRNEFPAELFQAQVELAYRDQSVGPLDVPFTLRVPGPVEVFLQPDAPVAARVSVTLSISKYCCTQLDGATRTRALLAATPVALAPWSSGVFVQVGGAAIIGTWRDAAAAAIGTFNSGVRAPRPREAVSVEVAAPALLTEFFT